MASTSMPEANYSPPENPVSYEPLSASNFPSTDRGSGHVWSTLGPFRSLNQGTTTEPPLMLITSPVM